MVLCGLLVMLLKLYLYTKSLNVGYWPTAAGQEPREMLGIVTIFIVKLPTLFVSYQLYYHATIDRILAHPYSTVTLLARCRG